MVGKSAGEKAKIFGIKDLLIYVRGIGVGRESAIRGLASTGINISAIFEDTPVAHGGVRPAKPRRV